MKKYLTHPVIYMAVALLLCACGASKNTTTTETVTIPSESVSNLGKCFMYAHSAPVGTLRGVGTYDDDEKLMAYRGAVAAAQADLSDRIRVCVENGFSYYRKKVGKGTTAGSETKKINEKQQSDESSILTFSKNAVSGAKVVMSEMHTKGDILTIDVCVEMDVESIMKMIESSNTLEDLISEDEEQKIDENKEVFRQSLRDAFLNNK